ncbi:MAG TPA: GDSL-type esterase/lipase family protein [Candidatus Aquicultor sp.]|jgi:lysophospholipase L1-like esterase
MRLKNGDTVVFFGDSITKANFGSNYIAALMQLFRENGIMDALKFVNAGRDGDMVGDLISRVDRDVVMRKPDWVVVLVGINDVYYESIFMADPALSAGSGQQSATRHLIDHFSGNYSTLIDSMRSATDNIAVCTTTGLEGDVGFELTERLAIINDRIRTLAYQKHCNLIDVAPAFRERTAELRAAGHQEEYMLTIDGVHLGSQGADVVAHCLFEFFTQE